MNLNLGCGNKILEGYTNVDKYDYYNCDIVHDLEKFPYPFENNSIDILEFYYRTTRIWFGSVLVVSPA